MRRAQTLTALAMLFACALPDAMVVPVLRQLLVERYGVSIGAAHAFMYVNLIGALFCVRFIRGWQRRFGDRELIFGAALLNGVLLAAMALPIGFAPTLALRGIEGAADLVVYAVLFNRLARLGSASTRGRRMGAAATSMMLGIAGGVGIGGLVGGHNAVLSLWFGAAACLIVAALAGIVLGRHDNDVNVRTPDIHPIADALSNRGLWPVMMMMFSDRAVAALLATTVPLYMTSVAGLTSARTGALVGISMLMTALGAWPAGWLVERIGSNRMRRIAGCMYAGGVLSIPFIIHANFGIALAGMIVIGIAGAALFASSLVAVTNSGRGAAGMGGYHTAGNMGFLLGTVAAGSLISLLSSGEPGEQVYITILTLYAMFHFSVTILTTGLVRLERLGPVLLPWRSRLSHRETAGATRSARTS